MSEPPFPQNQHSADPTSAAKSALTSAPTPLRCFTGAFIAAPFAFGLYALTSSIAQAFANKPLPTTNALAANISVLVRTLVVGMGALGTGIFGITTLGLVALGIQLLIKGSGSPSPSDEA